MSHYARAFLWMFLLIASAVVVHSSRFEIRLPVYLGALASVYALTKEDHDH